jgi:HAD superfamily hydrolase (TIGR01490 family)
MKVRGGASSTFSRDETLVFYRRYDRRVANQVMEPKESTNAMIAAIFDLDGTLYTGHLTYAISEHHRTHRMQRIPLYAFMAVHWPMWGLVKAGILSESSGRAIWARNLSWTLRGMKTDKAAAAFRWIAEEYVRPRVRENVIARLQEHQAAGHRVILLSGTFVPLLSEIGKLWGVTEVVGTPLIAKNGRYTGGSARPGCQGEHKVTWLKRHLADDAKVNLEESYAYADSITDLAVLESVGHPVAVHPDPLLEGIAQEKGWEIIAQA